MKKNLTQVLISVFFLGLLIWSLRKDFGNILQTIRSVRIEGILGGILLCLGSILFMSKRLQLIYSAQDVRIPLHETMNLTLVGFFFNHFLPTSVGGDLVKAYCGARVTGQKLKSLVSVLMDRVFGLLIYIMIPTFTVFFFLKSMDPRVIQTIVIALGGACLACFLLFGRHPAQKIRQLLGGERRSWLGDKLLMLYEGMHGFKAHRWLIAPVSLLSLAGQLLNISAIYFFIVALSAEINPLYVFMMTPIVHLVAMFPSINGLGIRETAFVYFFKDPIGLPNASALAILYLFLLFLLGLWGGVVYLLHPQYHFRMREAQTFL